MTAAELQDAEQRWARALELWAIPPHILAAAPEDPWGFPVERFAGRADRAVQQRSGASFEEAERFIAAVDSPAVDSLGATVLDVGAGAGAASLPHTAACSAITALDANRDMLTAFAERAEKLGITHREVLGSWPQDASAAGTHDVVLCHHVVYNVGGIGPFLRGLTGHARLGVVLEMPPAHPLTWMNPLWEHFYGLARPSTPTVDELLTILTLQGVGELRAQRWSRFDPVRPDGASHDASNDASEDSPQDRVALVARRLCLARDRIPELEAVLAQLTGNEPKNFREVVTISWSGTAR